jgi:predicted dienelactone hydrolase
VVGSAKSRQAKRQKLRQSLGDVQNLDNRLKDIPFVLDELARRNATGPWAGRLDLNRIGMAGHSYGARSTMFAAGQWVERTGSSAKEPRIKAALLLSPNLPNRQF